MCIDNINTEGLQCWNTDRDILDQYETFNGLPVYYGGDLYDLEDSELDDPYALASAAYVEDYNFDVPDGMDLMRPGAHRLSRSEITVDVETKPHVDNDPDDPDQLDIGRNVRGLPDTVPAMLDMTAAVPLAMPVVIQTRPQVSCDPALPLPVYKGQESLMEDGPDDMVSGRESIIPDPDVRCGICVIPDRLLVVVPRSNLLLPGDMSIEPLDVDGPDILISGRESTVMISDVGRDICVEPDQLLVVVSKEVIGPLAFAAVDLTRSQVGGALVVAWPADDDMISEVEVDQDRLSGQIMKPVDPDEESGDQMSLNAVPDVNGDACHTEWRETVIEDAEMEKFVLVPEVCPVVSMTSAAEPTFRPALSEVYSPVVLAGGGGGCCGIPPGSGRVRYSVSVCPAGGRVRYSASVCPAGLLK